MDPQRLDVILPTNVPWNASNLTRMENPEISAGSRAILVAVIALQMVTGSVLNTLVILLFLLNVHLLQVPSNLIVFSLSSSDFISSSIFLPFHLYTVSSYRSRSVWVKKLDGSLAVLCFNAGINGIPDGCRLHALQLACDVVENALYLGHELVHRSNFLRPSFSPAP